LYDIIKQLEIQVEKDKERKKDSISFLTSSPSLDKSLSNEKMDPISRKSSFSKSPNYSPKQSPERYSSPVEENEDPVFLRKKLFLLENNYSKKCQEFSNLSTKHQNLRNGYKILLGQLKDQQSENERLLNDMGNSHLFFFYYLFFYFLFFYFFVCIFLFFVVVFFSFIYFWFNF
jgi:hypothetical protein